MAQQVSFIQPQLVSMANLKVPTSSQIIHVQPNIAIIQNPKSDVNTMNVPKGSGNISIPSSSSGVQSITFTPVNLQNISLPPSSLQNITLTPSSNMIPLNGSNVVVPPGVQTALLTQSGASNNPIFSMGSGIPTTHNGTPSLHSNATVTLVPSVVSSNPVTSVMEQAPTTQNFNVPTSNMLPTGYSRVLNIGQVQEQKLPPVQVNGLNAPPPQPENYLKMTTDGSVVITSAADTFLQSSKHNNNYFICPLCSKIFQKLDNLKRHELCHTDEKHIPCSSCPKLANRQGFKKKIKIPLASMANPFGEMKAEDPPPKEGYHNQLVQTDDLFRFYNLCSSLSTSSSGSGSSDMKPEVAPSCALTFSTFNNRTLNPLIGGGAGAPVKKKKRKWKPPLIEGDFKCMLCPKRFTRAVNLERHQMSHSGERPFSCPYCPKTFRQRSHVQVHQRCHTGERPYKCPECPQGFASLANLQVHVRKHTGMRPYSCAQCTKAFYQLSHLQVHLRIHSGEKPFQCPSCPKAFRQLSNLQVHFRTHR